MISLRFTLVTDGSSDRVLLPILRWLIEQHASVPFDVEWLDPRHLPKVPRGLPERIRLALELRPCEVLLIHRDAERESREKRVKEILAAAGSSRVPPIVCVVPVRMTEAWLLFDEQKIRVAAGRPEGGVALEMPKLRLIENTPDPKRLLYELLRRASGRTGRRLRDFRENDCTYRLARLFDDFSPLRELTAFNALEQDILNALRGLGVARS